MSARRAGMRVWAADLFADADLRRCGPAKAVEDYPAGLERAAATAPAAAPWAYTGGLENHPDLVDRIAASRPLLGNPGHVLRAVRDPARVAGALARHEVAVPEVRETCDGLPMDGSWLLKPRDGCGGSAIRAWRGRAATDQSLPARRAGWYFQRRVDGEPCAAVYVAARGRAALVGVTRQLIGTPWAHAGPFQYAGSLGPLVPAPLDAVKPGGDRPCAGIESESLRKQAERIGNVLAAEFGLAGLFGVDAVLAGDALWPVEVNPRYTASVEVLERSLGVPAMAWHVAACREGRLPEAEWGAAQQWCGKAVLYAAGDVTVPAALEAFSEAENCDPLWPNLADLPDCGTRIAAGRPVLTVLASAADERLLEAALRARLARAEAVLWPLRTHS